MTQKRKAPPAGAGSVSPPVVKRKLQSTTTQNTVANFFKPTSEKAPEKIAWTTLDSTLLVAHYRPSAEEFEERRTLKRRRIAAFDLDGTLIRTQSGNRFSKDATDWKWWDGAVPGELKKLDDDGYQIIIISNQRGITIKEDPKKIKQDQKRLSEFKAKVNAIMAHFDFPISVFAATEQDKYRKPRTGMWTEMLDYFDLDDGEIVDMEKSFFVGDAAGRLKDEEGDVHDFASSDRDFASNVGISFHTPEEYFLGEKVKPFRSTFDPTPYLDEAKPAPPFTKLSNQEIVLFCGSPGAGKSTFFQTHLSPLGYERINQDVLKTRDKCLKTAKEYLGKGSSVAIDNTNPAIDTRAHWVDLANKFSVPIRCVYFTANTLLSQHNGLVRALNTSMNPENRTVLPKLAYDSFASHLQTPTLEEGFADITVVDFIFRGTKDQRGLWAQHYIS